MNTPELWLLSLQAFAAVITVLGVLAAAVQLLTLVFRAAPAATSARPASGASAGSAQRAGPASTEALRATSDPFVQAAVHAAVGQVAPGAVVTSVTEVEEEAPR